MKAPESEIEEITPLQKRPPQKQPVIIMQPELPEQRTYKTRESLTKRQQEMEEQPISRKEKTTKKTEDDMLEPQRIDEATQRKLLAKQQKEYLKQKEAEKKPSRVERVLQAVGFKKAPEKELEEETLLNPYRPVLSTDTDSITNQLYSQTPKVEPQPSLLQKVMGFKPSKKPSDEELQKEINKEEEEKLRKEKKREEWKNRPNRPKINLEEFEEEVTPQIAEVYPQSEKMPEPIVVPEPQKRKRGRPPKEQPPPQKTTLDDFIIRKTEEKHKKETVSNIVDKGESELFKTTTLKQTKNPSAFELLFDPKHPQRNTQQKQPAKELPQPSEESEEI